MSYSNKEKANAYAREYYHKNKKSEIKIIRDKNGRFNNPNLIEMKLEIIDDYNNGNTMSTIAEKYHTSKSSIRRFLLKHNVKIRSTVEINSNRTGSSHFSYNGYGEITGTKWASIVHAAKIRNLDFNISIEDAWKQFEKQNGICALTGIKLIFAKNVKEHSSGICTASLDRIDSSKGYLVDNIQWVHKDINIMKQNYNEDYFIELCRKVAQHKSI